MKRFLALLLGISMLSSHFVVPVYAAEEPIETACVEEQSVEENIAETLLIESLESDSIDSIEREVLDEIVSQTEIIQNEKESFVEVEGFEKKEEVYLAEPETEELETETEIEYTSISNFVYINPIYRDTISEADILSGVSEVSSIETLGEDDSYLTTDAELVSVLRNGMENRVTEISVNWISAKLLEKADFDQLIENAYEETGVATQGDYIRLNYGGATSSGGYYIIDGQYYYSMTFYMKYYTTYEQEAAVTAEVANVLSSLNLGEDSTEYQKVKAIYDWVCANVTYDYTNLNDSDYLLKYTTYAALINRTSVCQGYSSLMYRLLREVGISTRCITGTSSGGGHAWNIVKLDDYFYNIDATWDAGQSSYGYFLKSNDDFDDHIRDAKYTTDAFYASYPMADSNYAAEEVVDYEIKEENIALEYTQHEFAAVALKPEVTVTKNGQTLEKDVDYTVAYYDNYDAGQARVVVKGIGDYSGQVTKNFTITKHILRKDEITLSFYSAEYTGSAIKPAVTIKYNGKTFVDKSTNWGGVYYQNNINIGTAEVLIETERISSNFEIGVQIINFEIVPIDITKAQVTLDKTSFTYTGTQIQPSVTEVYLKGKGGILTEGTHYTVRYGENLNNGTGYVYIDGKGNYSGTYEYPITISRVGVYNASLTVDVDATELVYNGQAQTPPYTITYNGIPLVEGVDYTVAYYNNVNASGSAYVEVEGMGNFHSKTSRSFRINQASLKNAEITLDKTSYFYTGEMISPKPVVKYGDTILVEDKDYTLGYNDNTEIGTATVTVKGMGNYTGNVALNFEIIDGYQIKDEHVTLEYASHQFTGSDLHPEVTVVVDEEVLIMDKDYTVNYENCFNVLDTPKVTITGIGNWSGTVEKTFSITKVPISDISITIDSEVHEYTGKEIYPKVTVQYGKYKTIISQMNYSAYYAEYRNNVDITKNDRQAYVKIILDEINVNYEPAHVYVYFDIVGKDIAKNASVTLSNTYFTYTGNANEPKVASVIRGSKPLVEGTDYTVRYENNINAGTGKVHIDGIGIYSGTVTTSFTIAKAQISKANIVVDSTNCIYNGEEQIPDYTVTFNDIELVEGEDYVPSFENNTNAGTATISFMGFKNFQSTTKKNFEIKAASISDAEISLPQDTYVHTGSAITPEPKVVVDGRTLVKDTDYTVSYSNNEKIGVANFEITGVGNYTGTVEKTFEIVGKDISNAVVTLQYSEHKYTGSKLKPTVTVAVDDVLLEKGVDYEVTYSDNQFIYDTPKVTIKGIGSWSGNIEKTFTITPVLEEDVTITLDQDVYEYTGSEIYPVVKLKYLSTTYFVYAMSDRYFTWYYNNINVTSGDQKAKVGFYLDDIDPNYENKYVEVEFDIVEKNISDFTVTLEKASYDYTGNDICPKIVSVTDGINTLIENTDYTVSYENNVNAGNAKVCIEGIGNYVGNIKKTFTINHVSVSEAEVTLSKNLYVYTGSEITPKPKVIVDGRTLIKDVDYLVTYSNNKDAGTASITITGVDNYRDSKTVTFDISKSDQSLSVSIDKTNIEINETGKITVVGQGVISYKSLAPEIAEVDDSGSVKGIKTGHAVVEVSADGGINYNSAVKTIEIKVVCERHNYNNGVVTVEPTCEEVGTRLFTCTKCGETKTGKEPALNHAYSEEWTVDKEASCKEAGSKSHHCTNKDCGAKADITEIAQLEHSYDDGKITTQPTGEKEGVKTYTCSSCGDEKTESVPKLKQYKVTFDANGGSKAPAEVIVTKDQRLTLPNSKPVRDGYTFEGWYTEKSGGTEVVTGSLITNDMIVYAHWKQTYIGVEAFVARLYNVCLNREPDAGGLKAWSDKLKSKQIDGVNAAHGFVFSTEFINKNLCNEDYVKLLYKAFLGREADASGLKAWVTTLESGKTREHVFNGFAMSTEFGNLCTEYEIVRGKPIPEPAYGVLPRGNCSVCGKEDGVTGFVTRLYRVCLNREPDIGGLNAWCDVLRSRKSSGREVAYGFIFSSEFINKNLSNEDYVEHLYKAFMGRDSDAAGKAAWIKVLEKGESRKHVFDGFVGSREFTEICKSYGILRD